MHGDTETEFLLLNGDPQSSPASVKRWIAEHDDDPSTTTTKLFSSPDAKHNGNGTNKLNGTGGAGTAKGVEVQVEGMSTADLSALVLRVVRELQWRGEIGKGEAVEMGVLREAALRLFAVCGGGGGGGE